MNLDLSRSWMIGDHETDITAGRAAGCRTIRVGEPESSTAADQLIPDMDALPGLLETLLPPRP